MGTTVTHYEWSDSQGKWLKNRKSVTVTEAPDYKPYQGVYTINSGATGTTASNFEIKGSPNGKEDN